MTDLAAWLLEQLAEDERPTYELLPFQCEPGCCAPAGWVGHRCLICWTTEYGGTVEAIDAIAQEHAATVHSRARVLAECEAKRRIVEWHKSWPVLVETEPEFTHEGFALQLSKRIAWLTQQEYVQRFGTEPPAAPILRLLASVYADRPGYDEAWRP